MRRRIAVLLGFAVAAAALVSISASSSTASTPLTTCDGTYSGVTFSTLTVPQYASCIVSDSRVIGSVTVNKNAEFDACNVTVGGSVGATQAYVNIDNSSSIGGSLTLTQPGSTLSVGGSPCTEKGSYEYSAYVCPHYVGGSVNVRNAPYNEYLEVSIGECGGMSIHGSVNVQGNRQYVEIDDANIVGALVCTNNWPPAEAFDVSVGGAVIGCEVYVP